MYMYIVNVMCMFFVCVCVCVCVCSVLHRNTWLRSLREGEDVLDKLAEDSNSLSDCKNWGTAIHVYNVYQNICIMYMCTRTLYTSSIHNTVHCV